MCTQSMVSTLLFSHGSVSSEDLCSVSHGDGFMPCQIYCFGDFFCLSHPASGPHSLQHLGCGCHSISGRQVISHSPCSLQVPLVCTYKEMVWCLYFPGCTSTFLCLSSEPNANRTLQVWGNELHFSFCRHLARNTSRQSVSYFSIAVINTMTEYTYKRKCLI